MKTRTTTWFIKVILLLSIIILGFIARVYACERVMPVQCIVDTLPVASGCRFF